MDNRARLTLPDVAWFVASMAVLAALVPVLIDAMDQQASEIPQGVLYVFQIITPLAVLVLFYVVYLKARAGVAG